ncbi:methyl-accepting chemotaxis protein [Pseudoalteromonas phenolica]|uniref:methyl-accepting chemotaxis protein n=1 Tax=Pseudoalteromonas phenolica TaxID=161398 RepID=UPI001024E100|nr:methyl-accepting chemotaxis protein [Pseudoalteromonas phenolica]RXF03580.1 methyl-accepting chemotaxis protein [Pseudoalteromonas phenolica O-BC30]
MPEKNWQLYLKNVTSTEEKRLISLAEQQREKVDQLIAIYLSEIRENTFSAKDYSFFVKETYSTFDPLSESFGDLINYQVKQAQLLKIEGDEEAEKVEFSLITLSIVIVFTMLSVGFLIYRSINTPLTKMGKTIEQVVRDTDLTIRVEENGSDEFSKIAIDFNMMMDKFQTMLSQISSAINSLSGLSSQVASSGDQMASSALEQEQQTAMIAQAITEMSSAIAEVSENASRTATYAEDAENLSIEGQKTIEQSIQAIHELAELVVNNAKLINELNNQTTEINQVVMMIQGVAEQTNLLASMLRLKLLGLGNLEEGLRLLQMK